MNPTDDLTAALGDQYSIERELGGGGMSRVFLAQDRALQRQVVIKLLAPELAAGVNRERFGREVLLAARLQHPNIVPVLAAGTAGDLPFYIMPFVAGESLRALVANRGPLPVREAVSILRDVARGLAYAHGEGVVHRDIKPDNVLRTGGAAMVTDFGIAKALAEGRAPGGSGLTTVGTSLGTLDYMAPEQAAADPNVDHRADLYSLGAMGYELLAGRPPFAGLPPRELLTAIVAKDAPPLETLRSDLPAPLVALIRRCLAKDPGERPQSAEEVVAALEAASTISGELAVPARQAKPRMLRLALFMTAGILLALAAGYLLSGRRSAHPLDNSLVVLPLEQSGGTSDDAYFSEGITDELTTTLARIPSLRVAASASAFAFKGKPVDPREVGRALNVANVLTGTVRRSTDRVRVTVQLIGAGDGLVRWADSYERETGKMQQVQDEIARAIASALSMALAPGAMAAGPTTRDVEAYDLYLRGRFYWRQRGGPALRIAADYFSRAIARDSAFAAAWAGLADAVSLLPVYGRTPIDSVLPIAERAAARAVALDSTLGEAHAALGQLYRSTGRWAESDRALARAIAVDSTNASAHQWQGELFVVLNRPKEAVSALETAARLEPLSPIITGELGYIRALAGEWDSAFAAGQRAVELAPSLWTGYAFLGTARLWHGDTPEAIRNLEHAMTLAPENPFGGVLAHAYARAGQAGRARALTDSLARLADKGLGSPTTVALGFAGLGDADQMFAWFDRAVAVRDGLLYSTPLYAPWLASYRSDQRYLKLKAKLGLSY